MGLSKKRRLFDDDIAGGNLNKAGRDIQNDIEKLIKSKVTQWVKKYDRHDLRHVVATGAEWVVTWESLKQRHPVMSTAAMKMGRKRRKKR